MQALKTLFIISPWVVTSACQPDAAPGASEGSPGASTSTADPGGSGTGSGPPTTGEAPVPGTSSITASTTMTSSTASDATTSDATTSDGTTGDGTTGAAVCGNGVVEGDEGCDAGFEVNKNTGPCTMSCEVARCGDGFVQSSNAEVCDDGPQNAVIPAYNQCSTECARGPHCGDGIVQFADGEECEPGGRQDSAKNCGSMCAFAPRIVFLTSESFTGDLNGLAGADKRCNELAAASPDLQGAFRAWLLVDGQSLADRFPEFGDDEIGWNFRSMGNQLLAKSFQQLVGEGPAGPLVYTEMGEALTNVWVWTNISAAGVAAGGDCGQWTDAAGSAALAGLSGFLPDVGPEAAQWHAARWWTEYEKKFCDKPHHIYCIQVAD